LDRGERIDDLSGCCRIIARSAAPTSILELEMFPDNLGYQAKLLQW